MKMTRKKIVLIESLAEWSCIGIDKKGNI